LKIITVASLKGGVGKTTLAAFLSAALSTRGKTLCIDFDANNNLTDYFSRDLDDAIIEDSNSFHVLTQKKTAAECIIHSGLFMDYIPGALSLHRLTAEMIHRPGALLKIKSLFPDNYDYIVIDTAPSLDWSTFAGLYAADLVLSPVNLSRWSLQAARLLSDEIQHIPHKPEIRFIPSIVTKNEVETLKDLPGITQTAIHKSGAIRTASNKGQRLKENMTAWAEFTALADEIGGRNGK